MSLTKFVLLDLSTQHLSQATTSWMEAAAKVQTLGIMERDEGFFIGTSFAADPDMKDGIPADLWHCMRFANVNGADYLLFDRDADLTKGLPSHVAGNTPDTDVEMIGTPVKSKIIAADGTVVAWIRAIDADAVEDADLMVKVTKPALEDDDYIVKSGVWLTAANASTRITHDDNEVRVTVLPLHHEMEDALAEIAVSCHDLAMAISDAQAEIDAAEEPGV